MRAQFFRDSSMERKAALIDPLVSSKRNSHAFIVPPVAGGVTPHPLCRATAHWMGMRWLRAKASTHYWYSVVRLVRTSLVMG